jgi:hypothetical protein
MKDMAFRNILRSHPQDISKRRVFATVLGRLVTQNSHIISFTVVITLDHNVVVRERQLLCKISLFANGFVDRVKKQSRFQLNVLLHTKVSSLV